MRYEILSRTKRVSRPRDEAKPVVTPTMLLIGGVIIAVIIMAGLVYTYSQEGATAIQLDEADYPVLGEANAPVTMVDFSDYGCPHCQDYKLETYPQLKKDYIDTGKLRYVVHPFYLGAPDIGQATEANWCAVEQNKFFEYREVIYQNVTQARNSQSDLVTLAAKVEGLDPSKLEACLSAGTYREKLEAARLAASRQGIKSTPTFFINGQKIEGNQPYETLKQVIERELAKAPNM